MPKYIYAVLEKMQRDGLKSDPNLYEPNVDAYKVKIAWAAAHALDIIDASKINRNYLDLTINSNQNMLPVTLYMHISNLHNGMTIEESRQSLVSKLGAYQLFTLYNFISEFAKPSIVLGAPKLKIYSDILDATALMLQITNPKTGANFYFDVFKAMEYSLKYDCTLSERENISEIKFSSFHRAVQDKILVKLKAER